MACIATNYKICYCKYVNNATATKANNKNVINLSTDKQIGRSE